MIKINMFAKKFTFLIIFLVVALLAGLGFFVLGYNSVRQAEVPEEYLDPIFAQQLGQKFVNAQIKSIADNYLIVKVAGSKVNQEKKVLINYQTEILRQKQSRIGTIEQPDFSVIQEKIRLVDLQVGDLVVISAKEAIDNKIEFIASKIVLTNVIGL